MRQHRLEVYARESRPLLDYYRSRPTFRSINGAQAPERVAAELSSALFDTTVKAATLFAAGQMAAGVVSLQAASLARGVLRAMFLSKLKVAVALLLGISVVAWSATRFAGPSLAAGSLTETVAAATEPPLSPENAKEADDELLSAPRLKRDQERADLSDRRRRARHESGHQLCDAQRHAACQHPGDRGEHRRANAHIPH